ncbi:TRAP transporter large permease [Thermoanaerobacteraceae bacterium SP2]|nr:TRAP transporter large permease [Thermoanaerobacteraceae bacterium SP2]
MTGVLILEFLILIIFGIPIAFALGIAALVAIVNSGAFSPVVMVQRMTNGINSFTLVAVPLFIVAGRLAGETGLAKRLVRLATTLVGHVPGGLSLVTVLASMFFGGISGSAAADASCLGSLLIPAMEKEKYDPEYAGGVMAPAATIGILIPPSIPMCIYGVTVGVSIGALFMGGLIPGILVGFFQMFIAYLISKKRKYPKLPRAKLIEVWKAFKDSFLSLFMPVFMLAGVAFGIATPTEIGVIAVIYALILGVFVYHEYDIRQIPSLLVECGVQTAVACIVVAFASVVSWMFAMDHLPMVLLGVLSKVGSPIIVLLIINVFLLFVGCLIDLVPAMILFAPILLPVVTKMGIDPIQFGAIMTCNLAIGLVTPPVGTCLFISSSIADVPMLKLFKEALPFVLCNLFVLLLVTFWQPVSMFVPRLLGY